MMMNKNVAYLLLWGIICCAALVGASDMHLNPQVERARPDSAATTAIAAIAANGEQRQHSENFPPLGSGRFPHYQQKSKMIQHFERLLEQRSSSFSPENPPPDVSPPLDFKQIYAEVAHLGKGLSELGQLYKQSNQRNMELFHEMLECHKRQQQHNARFELQLQQNQKGTRESAARASTRKPPKTANIALPVLLVVAVVVPAILLGHRVLHTKRRRRVTSPSLLRK